MSPLSPPRFLLSLLSALYTWIIFYSFCLLIPWLACLYIGVGLGRRWWLRWLERRFPGLEFVREISPRSAVDTRRSQGLVTALLETAGPSPLSTVRLRIREDIVEKRGGDGGYVYPHLKVALSSRLGRYCWVLGSRVRFRLERHVLAAPPSFRGRPLTEANVQDYVSDVVSKQLDSESPPWQVILVEISDSDKRYLLVRLHHLYTSEDKLALGTLLALGSTPPREEAPTPAPAVAPTPLPELLFKTPRVLFEEVFLPESPRNVHYLQTLSSCGRRVVSWSPPTPRSAVVAAARAVSAAPGHLLLAATAAALRDYFDEMGSPVPEAVMTTWRRVSVEGLLLGGPQPLLCLPLPTLTEPSSPLEGLAALQEAVRRAEERQAGLRLASERGLDAAVVSRLLPSLVSRAALYLLSRRYTVSLTQVEAGREKSDLLWGAPVHNIVYWRPPQANVCLSLTLMSYGDVVQLGVMSDAQLSPQHTSIARSFTARLHQICAGATSSLSHHHDD